MLPPLGFDDFDPLDRYEKTAPAYSYYHHVLPSLDFLDDAASPSFVEALDNFFSFLNVIQSNVAQELRSQHGRLRHATQSIRRRLKKDLVEEKFRRQLGGFRARLAEPPVVALRHKVSFFLGVTNVVLAAFTLGRAPAWTPTLYALDFLLLVVLRVWIYRRKGWQYFTLDLCYYANALLLAFLFIFPESPILLGGVVALTHGPVLWAILQWRNSLVFHSLDKITSCFIHFCPAVVLYGVRWLSDDSQRFPLVLKNWSLDWRYTLIPGLGLHLVWQSLYYIIVNIHKQEKVSSGKRVTSYTWLVQEAESRNTLFFKAINFFGPAHRLAMYMLLQFGYTFVTVLPTHLVWNSQAFHTCLLLVMFAVCAWNGATYYVDVFSHSYAASIRKLHEEWMLNGNGGGESTGAQTPADEEAFSDSPCSKSED
eukprot:Gregarina_sp_Pseudo_9__1078@NODE_1700_length_1385_cov_6_677563_g1576_i0_p1_GENE_NODE_1700_length_1385_cov_6_677563_g1576_i0NODE_1700_length_1385_cov_6_677563_g1576_i0_p1_ORF_typecomplete_len424_score82_94DUF2838/PF10998_8/2_8e37DUF2838/PF10998_8/2_8e02YdjC/PF04794_12/0_27Itfg2/PF15907_5/0_25_NODE_1700_length_1385_cov_6_677563_g1576_i0561327